MGFYAPAQIVRDAERHGVTVLPPDVNLSDWYSKLEEIPARTEEIIASPGGRGLQLLATPDLIRGSLETKGEGLRSLIDGSLTPHPSRLIRSTHKAQSPLPPGEANPHLHPIHANMAQDIRTRYSVRLGLHQIKGFKEDDAETIMKVRGHGFDSVRDLWLRTGLPRAAIERLADGDAFRSLGLDRRDALWAARGEGALKAKDRLPLFDVPEHGDIRKEPDFGLPPMLLGEHVVNDYRYLSLSLKAHPLSFLRERLTSRGIIPAVELRTTPNNRRATVAGLVITRH